MSSKHRVVFISDVWSGAPESERKIDVTEKLSKEIDKALSLGAPHETFKFYLEVELDFIDPEDELGERTTHSSLWFEYDQPRPDPKPLSVRPGKAFRAKHQRRK